MKLRLLSNQLNWIAESLLYHTFKANKASNRNNWRVREYGQKKLDDLYFYIHRVKNAMDRDLEKRAMKIRIHRETMKEIEVYNAKYGEDSWYNDIENLKPI